MKGAWSANRMTTQIYNSGSSFSVVFLSLQVIPYAAARLIARLPRFSHISTFMTEDLHWLPLTTPIQFKILFLTCKTFLGQAPRYLCDLMRRPQLHLDVLSAL